MEKRKKKLINIFSIIKRIIQKKKLEICRLKFLSSKCKNYLTYICKSEIVRYNVVTGRAGGLFFVCEFESSLIFFF